MKFYNYELKNFYDFLLSIELRGKQSRMRTKLCKLIGERLHEITDERDKLIAEFVERDENNNPLTKEAEGGKLKYILRDTEAFAKEYDLLMQEEFIIEENEVNKDMLMTVADVVLNLDIPLKGQEAILHERYCEVLESLNYYQINKRV
ncbi:hypothetical protein EDM57_20995 [Brevibacillus gelatini]|uniref:DUF1617 family protein n=1 Tax=Brevibacillus gelatini TaxID=1655277 RepID=A0A3M8APT5_9BACL|nr:hypothetical protein [Brevibacillus gelatini]RNB52667.1 hypothetical protein EDM57_20995 [Brevibacillus gelatini]